MSTAGMHARRGFSFQDLVSVYYSLTLLSDVRKLYVQAESVGLPDGGEVHVDDIVIGYKDGSRDFIQVKMTAIEFKGWSISSLDRAGELKKIVAQLSANHSDHVVLICPHGFGDLEKLTESVIASPNAELYLPKANGPERKWLDSFAKRTKTSHSESITFLRRIQFGPRHAVDSP
jgi:hypothetical protein